MHSEETIVGNDNLKSKIDRMNQEICSIRDNRTARNQSYLKETEHYTDQLSSLLQKLEGHSSNYDEVNSKFMNVIQHCKFLNDKCEEMCEEIQKKDEEIEQRILNSKEKISSLVRRCGNI